MSSHECVYFPFRIHFSVVLTFGAFAVFALLTILESVRSTVVLFEINCLQLINPLTQFDHYNCGKYYFFSGPL